MWDRLIVVVALATVLLPASVSWGQAKEAVTKTRPLTVLDGRDSQVNREKFMRLTSDKVWNDTWAEHVRSSGGRTSKGLMEVDFSRVMVVALFLGETINCSGIEVVEMLESQDSITIRVTSRYFQTSGEDNNRPPDRPYAFIVVPKSDKEIVIEDNRQSLLGEPPIWKLRARLPRVSRPRSE